MTMKPTINDREFDKFKETTTGKTAVRITAEDGDIGNISGTLSPSGLNKYGLHTEVEIVDFEWRPVPPTPLPDRNFIILRNDTSVDFKINYDNAANVLAVPLPTGYKGMTVKANNELYRDIKDTVILYARAKTGTLIIDAEELA